MCLLLVTVLGGKQIRLYVENALSRGVHGFVGGRWAWDGRFEMPLNLEFLHIFMKFYFLCKYLE